jgi:hypothetical protein
MASGSDDLLPKTGEGGTGLVGNQKASEQGIPAHAGKCYGMNWTQILDETGLEAPGYHETVRKMREQGRIKGY